MKPRVFLKRWANLWLTDNICSSCQKIVDWDFRFAVRLYTAISIKVVHEQSGKVEYERERLLGIANKLMNFQSDSQQPFAQPTRPIQAVRNKLLRACCHQLVNNLLRAHDIRLVGTTCCESVGLINLVTR
jgi:hypothetical protein